MGYHRPFNRAQTPRLEGPLFLLISPDRARGPLWISDRRPDREDPRRQSLDAAAVGERRAHRAATHDRPLPPLQPGAVEGIEAYQVSTRSAASQYARHPPRAEG